MPFTTIQINNRGDRYFKDNTHGNEKVENWWSWDSNPVIPRMYNHS